MGQTMEHVGNEEEASESASNDAVVASLGRSVGGHARFGAKESDSLEQKRKMSWRETAQQKLRLSAADFVLVTWPGDQFRERVGNQLLSLARERERIYGQKAGEGCVTFVTSSIFVLFT